MSKVTYTEVPKSDSNSYMLRYKFKIEESILKEHYKELARMAVMFNAEEYNAGYIKKKDSSKFLNLLKAIAKSDDKKCSDSHQNAIDAKIKRDSSKKVKVNSVRCQHEDLGSLGYKHGDYVKCPFCGAMTEVW